MSPRWTHAPLFGALALALLTPGRAQVALPGSAPAQPAEQARALPLEPVPDEALEQRLRSVLAAIDDFGGVEIAVRSGVVRLEGSVPSSRARERLKELVGRFEGVAYVDDHVEAQADVESRLEPAVERARELASRALRRLPVFAVALAVVVLFGLLAWGLGRWQSPLRWLGVPPLLRELTQRLLASAVFVAGVVFALDVLEATAIVGAVLGVAGLAGLVLSFAFRDIVENYLAGILLSLRQQFAVGDHLSIEGREGKVVRLTSREMVLMTLDGNHLRIPNAMVFKSILTNFSRNPRRRFDFAVGIGTEENVGRAQRVGVRTLTAMKGVLFDPEASAAVEKLGPSSVDLRFFGWVDQREADFLKVRSEAIRLVKAALDEAGIELPEPIHRVHLRRLPEPGAPSPAAPAETAPAAEAQAAEAKVAVETEIDDQIREELATSAEPNLLEPERG